MTGFADRVLSWYEKHARVLPWRGHPDSYAVWVSEIMLQQTRVEAVIPYFEHWMEQFPTIEALAAAPQQAVLTAWEGLGYYSRARNLHKAAQILASQYSAQLPADPAELRKLPGIGRYTAAAIASIAFGRDVATLDGNLKRVFARAFNLSQPADSAEGESILWKLAETHLPPGRASDYNQALMDLGATICLPKNPRCLLCPVQELCAARALGIQEQRPVQKPKTAVPHKRKAAAVVILDGKTLLNQRPAGGLLGGLWEFPAAEVEADSAEALLAAIETAYQLKVTPLSRFPEIHHAYTHFKLTEIPWLCQLAAPLADSPLQWISLPDLPSYPMGKVDRVIARSLNSQ
jgi:A/G-specific adenine glycosylase